MHNKRLIIDFEGHRIEVSNVFLPLKLRSYEVLKVDDQVVAQSDSAILRQQTELSACVSLNGVMKNVAARVAATQSNPLRFGFQLFIDGNLSGDPMLRFMEETDVRKISEGGFLKYVFLHGIPTFGLPYAIIMVITNPIHGTLSFESLVLWVLGFGLFMSAFSFFVLKRRWKS